MIQVGYWKRPLAVLMVAVLFLCSVPVCMPVQAAAVSPIEALGKGNTVMSAVENNGIYTLYLPAYLDRSKVTLRYTGTTKLFCPATNAYLSPGQTGVFDLSSDSVMLYQTSADGGSDVALALRVMSGSDSVPSLHFSLDGDLDYIHENKENRLTGSLYMLNGKGREVYNGTIDTFKGRGNTSFTQDGLAPDKKSYSIKLTDKAELISGAGKMKKWALLHIRVCDSFGGYDFTGLSNMMSYQIYDALAGDGYADIKAQFVDVYIDGVYRGIYILAERVEVNAAVDISDAEEYISSSSEDTVVYDGGSDPAMKAGVQFLQYTADAVKKQDFDITGGYLLEVETLDPGEYYLPSGCGFRTAKNMLISIKAPEVCTKEQVSYIAQYFQMFENALYSETGYNEAGKHYSEYIDMESLASLVLTGAFMKNWELFRTSTYMYLDTKDSDYPVLTFGPSWDCETGAQMLYTDSTFFNVHQIYVDKYSVCHHFLGQLWTKGDFQAILYEKQQKLDKIVRSILGQTGTMNGITPVNKLWQDARESLEMNWARWDLERILNGKEPYKGHDNSVSYYMEDYVKAFTVRKNNWDRLWSDREYLLGLTVGQSAHASGGVVLSAQVTGRAEGYQWYRLTSTNRLETIENANKKTYLAQETGIYYCIASGGNNAYYGDSLEEIFNDATVYLTSQPVAVNISSTGGGSTTPGQIPTAPSFTPSTTTPVVGGSTTVPSGTPTGSTAPGETTPTDATPTDAAPSGGTTMDATQSTQAQSAEKHDEDTSDAKKKPVELPIEVRIALRVVTVVGCLLLLIWFENGMLIRWIRQMMI